MADGFKGDVEWVEMVTEGQPKLQSSSCLLKAGPDVSVASGVSRASSASAANVVRILQGWGGVSNGEKGKCIILM